MNTLADIASLNTPCALRQALDRACAVIEQENVALAARQQIGWDESGAAKARALLDLTRVARTNLQAPEIRPALLQLRDLLETNRALIAVRLQAAQDINAMLASIVRDAESDGTYAECSIQQKSP